MKVSKLLLAALISLTSISAFSYDKHRNYDRGIGYNQLIGDWEITTYDNEQYRKVFFNGESAKKVEVNFNKEGVVSSMYSKPKYYVLKNGVISFGKYKKNDKVYSQVEEWKVLGRVSEDKSYGMLCYEIKNIRMDAGVTNKKLRMKMCSDGRRYHRY